MSHGQTVHAHASPQLRSSSRLKITKRAAELEVSNVGAAAANSRSARGASACPVELLCDSAHERRIKPRSPVLQHGAWLTSSTVGAPRRICSASDKQLFSSGAQPPESFMSQRSDGATWYKRVPDELLVFSALGGVPCLVGGLRHVCGANRVTHRDVSQDVRRVGQPVRPNINDSVSMAAPT